MSLCLLFTFLYSLFLFCYSLSQCGNSKILLFVPGENSPYKTICQRNFHNNKEIYTRQWFLSQLNSDDSSKIIIEFVGTNFNEITVEPRSNGPTFYGIPPITDANSWSLQSVFF